MAGRRYKCYGNPQDITGTLPVQNLGACEWATFLREEIYCAALYLTKDLKPLCWSRFLHSFGGLRTANKRRERLMVVRVKE